jgi:hypothetical protein
MIRRSHSQKLALAAMAILAASCSSNNAQNSGSGGSSPSAGGASGGATTVSSGGQVGTGGSTPGVGGKGSGGSASGGAAGSGSGGVTSGAGGSSTGAKGGSSTGTGGMAGGGSGSGGSASGGSGAGGTAGNSGSSKGGSGGGGSANAGAGSGGTLGTGGSSGTTPGGTAVPSAGCGTTSTLTFGKDPNESGAPCTTVFPVGTKGGGTCKGDQPGYGTGGWLTISGPGNIGIDSLANGGRGFDVRLPDNYDKNHPYWLIFVFHPRGGTAAGMDNGGSSGYDFAYNGLQQQSKNGAIFVAPNGLGNGWGNSGGEDLTFTDDMVSLIQQNFCVDTTHIISDGFSWGSGMTYEIACARSKVFHAAVLYEGGVLSGCDPDPQGNTTDPIAFMQIEGLNDTTLSIGGSYSMRDKFVKNNSCTPFPSSDDNPGSALEPAVGGSVGHICTDYAGCSTGHPLRWCVTTSVHTPAPVDADPGNCCDGINSWTPKDVWLWLTSF